MIVCPFEDLKRYAPVLPGLEEALAAIKHLGPWQPGKTIPLSGGNRIVMQEGTTQPVGDRCCEAHRKFLDLQYILEGQEYVGWAPLDTLTPAGDFDREKDIGMYAGPVIPVKIPAGCCYVVFPEDGHMPGSCLEGPNPFRKLVVKLEVR